MVGVFDSGIGGLYVVRALLDAKPDLDILYYGDVAHLPYGNKSDQAVLNLTRRAVNWFATRRADHVVLACNTASAYALEVLRGELPMPIYGMIQPAVRSVLASGYRSVGVIATRGTVLSGSYQRSIQSQVPDAVVYPLACPLFVPLIEEGWLFHPLARSIIHQTLEELPMRDIHVLVLGCTHYPALTPLLSDLYPGLLFVDPTHAIAEELIPNLSGESGSGRLELCVSDMTPHLLDLARRILGRDDIPISNVGADAF